jgi:hypothetical protein
MASRNTAPTTFAALAKQYRAERKAWRDIPVDATTNEEDDRLAESTYEATENALAKAPIVDAADYLAALDILETASRALIDDCDRDGMHFWPATTLGIIQRLRDFDPAPKPPACSGSEFAALVRQWREARDALDQRAGGDETFDEDVEWKKIVAAENAFLAAPIRTNEDYAAAIELLRADNRDQRPGGVDEHVPSDDGITKLLEKLAEVRLAPVAADKGAFQALMTFEPHIYEIGHRSRLLLDGFVEDRIEVENLYEGYFCLASDIDTLAETLRTIWDAAVARAQGRS